MNSHQNKPEEEHYLSMAKEYDNKVEGLIPGSEHFFSSCLSFIPDGYISILELGSGTGYATTRIIKKNPDAKITCIDHSEEMIRCAQKKLELEKVLIVNQDIRDPWPEKRYGVIFTTLCLHHISENDRGRCLTKKCKIFGKYFFL